MAEKKYVMALDEGTSSARAIIFKKSGEVAAIGQREFGQIFPNHGLGNAALQDSLTAFEPIVNGFIGT